MMRPSRRPQAQAAGRAVAWSVLLVLAGCERNSGTSTVQPPPNPGVPALATAPAPRPDRNPRTANPTTTQETSPFRFTDILPESGIDFVHVSGMTEAKHYPTANGSGAAIFDYDGDGRMDLYFATGTLLPLGTARTGPNRLYQNLGGGRFRDVTEGSGLGFAGFCHGIAAGDIDNDGDPDVFLACYGPNRLYRNAGDGTFQDISHSAGIENTARPPINWASGGAFLDHDADGDLDLYVTIQGAWKLPDDDVVCLDAETGRRRYCSPKTIRTAKHVLFRNNGDLTFTDVTDAAGLGRADGHGFGAIAADVNGDGRVDLYVANDQNPNFLFLNRGDGTFEDATETSGAAFDVKGLAQSGMGVDAEDVDGDGRPELFVTNFEAEHNTLYQNIGSGQFQDLTPFYGLAADSMPWIGWGCALADFDNDGWPDSFVTNGHVDDNSRDHPYAQPPLLHHNVPAGDGRRFRLATRDVGPYFDAGHVGRGAAFGDLDDDGDIDIVVNHKDGPPAVLRNDTPAGGHWIRLRLVGTRSNRDAVGTRVEVEVEVEVEAGGRTIFRQVKTGVSILSSNDPRLLIGVGAATEVARLTIRWPAGAVSAREHVATDRTHEIVEPEEEGTR